MSNKFVVHKMEVDEHVSSFDCGDEDLNDFIVNEAQNYRKALLAVTYALTPEEDLTDVVAFCSLANDRVSLSVLRTLQSLTASENNRGFLKPNE